MNAKPTSSGSSPEGESTADELAVDLEKLDPLLAAGVAGVAQPSPRVKELLLARVRADKAREKNQAPEGWRFDSLHEAAGWLVGPFPGLRFKTLSLDDAGDVALVLVEMKPGSRFPDHLHELGGDEGILISGDVITGGRLLKAGDYYYAAEGTMHVDTVSPSGCTALIRCTARAWNLWRQFVAPQ